MTRLGIPAGPPTFYIFQWVFQLCSYSSWSYSFNVLQLAFQLSTHSSWSSSFVVILAGPPACTQSSWYSSFVVLLACPPASTYSSWSSSFLHFLAGVPALYLLEQVFAARCSYVLVAAKPEWPAISLHFVCCPQLWVRAFAPRFQHAAPQGPAPCPAYCPDLAGHRLGPPPHPLWMAVRVQRCVQSCTCCRSCSCDGSR